MPLFMDRHEGDPAAALDAAAVAELHARDLEVQSKYDVRYLTYWFDPANANVFCLVDAPSRYAAESVHREAHGQLASKVLEVDQDLVASFLGKVYEPRAKEAWSSSGMRTIMVSDIVSSTEMVERLGDHRAVELLRANEDLVRSCVSNNAGRVVKLLGDGALASFDSVVRGLEAAMEIQAQVEAWEKGQQEGIRVRVGLSAGEPVETNDDLFGAAIHLASRICSECPPGGVLAASAVRDLAFGKGFGWEYHDEASLKGFSEPVRVYRLTGRETSEKQRAD